MSDPRAPVRRDWSVSPGELLQELLDERHMPQTYLAFATGLTQKHINRVIKGHNRITVDMALRLESALDADAEFWLNAQMHHDLHKARS